MNKLSKVLLSIVIILTIFLGIITYLYCKMVRIANEFRDGYIEAATELSNMNLKDKNNEEFIKYIKSIEDKEIRRSVIDIYVENGDITKDMAKELY